MASGEKLSASPGSVGQVWHGAAVPLGLWGLQSGVSGPQLPRATLRQIVFGHYNLVQEADGQAGSFWCNHKQNNTDLLKAVMAVQGKKDSTPSDEGWRGGRQGRLPGGGGA